MRNTYGFAQIVQKMPKFFSFHLQKFVKKYFELFANCAKPLKKLLRFIQKIAQKFAKKKICAKIKSFRENPANRSKTNKSESGVHHIIVDTFRV